MHRRGLTVEHPGGDAASHYQRGGAIPNHPAAAAPITARHHLGRGQRQPVPRNVARELAQSVL
jgi:hypothetical protein